MGSGYFVSTFNNTLNVKYYIITGETSGDMHAANLVKALLKHDSQAVVRAWGGAALKKLPITLVKELDELNFMGLVEVLKHLKTIRSNFNFAQADIINFNPDVLILIDFPGFNLRIARWAKSKNIRVFYYISPTVWAWHKSRIKQIRRYIDKMFVILPFEKEFYKEHGIEAEYEGHPIMDALDEIIQQPANHVEFYKQLSIKHKPIIAILPGSRKQEIQKLLPMMLSVAPHFPEYEFVVAGLSSIDKKLYQPTLLYKNTHVVYDQTHILLKHSYAAIVKSGTSTLEAALFKIPQVVCYVVNPLTYFIARMLVSVKYISLVNLLLNRQSITELIQSNVNTQNLINELKKLLINEHRTKILNDYDELAKLLKEKGCSERIALKMIHLLQSS